MKRGLTHHRRPHLLRAQQPLSLLLMHLHLHLHLHRRKLGLLSLHVSPHCSWVCRGGGASEPEGARHR